MAEAATIDLISYTASNVDSSSSTKKCAENSDDFENIFQDVNKTYSLNNDSLKNTSSAPDVTNNASSQGSQESNYVVNKEGSIENSNLQNETITNEEEEEKPLDELCDASKETKVTGEAENINVENLKNSKETQDLVAPPINNEQILKETDEQIESKEKSEGNPKTEKKLRFKLKIYLKMRLKQKKLKKIMKLFYKKK